MKATSSGQDFLRRSGAPATIALIGASLGVFVISWLMQGKLLDPLAFWSDWSHPWGILTYPFANTGIGMGLFWFLLELYWLYWVGSSAEQDLGTTKYVGVFFGATVLAALFMWLGFAIIHPGAVAPVFGLSLPIAALTVIWAVRHPTQHIMMWMVIPIPGWILGWLTVALTLFGFGSMYAAPLMGAFACLHLGIAYLFAANRLPVLTYSRGSTQASRTAAQNLKRHERMDKQYFDDVRKREQERAEKERLRKLFEKSMMDDPDK